MIIQFNIAMARGSLEILSQGRETMLWQQLAGQPYMHHPARDLLLQKSNKNGTRRNHSGLSNK
jgi:hypothetical protein